MTAMGSSTSVLHFSENARKTQELMGQFSEHKERECWGISPLGCRKKREGLPYSLFPGTLQLLDSAVSLQLFMAGVLETSFSRQ